MPTADPLTTRTNQINGRRHAIKGQRKRHAHSVHTTHVTVLTALQALYVLWLDTVHNSSVLRGQIRGVLSRRYITPSSQAGGVGDTRVARSQSGGLGHNERVTTQGDAKGTGRGIPSTRAFEASVLDASRSSSPRSDTQVTQVTLTHSPNYFPRTGEGDLGSPNLWGYVLSYLKPC